MKISTCSRCDEEPTILSFGNKSFCSFECLTKETESQEESIHQANQMFDVESMRDDL